MLSRWCFACFVLWLLKNSCEGRAVEVDKRFGETTDFTEARGERHDKNQAELSVAHPRETNVNSITSQPTCTKPGIRTPGAKMPERHTYALCKHESLGSQRWVWATVGWFSCVKP